MSRRMILVYPACESELETDALLYQPLALAYVAAYTPAGYDIVSYDEYVGARLDPACEPADLVVMSSLTPNMPRAYELADAYRSRGAVVVLGGPHATALPEEALAHVDTVIKGEAEPVWERFLADYEAGRPQRIYDGGMDAPLTDLRPPRRDVIHPRYDYPSVLTSRGCPFACSFCYLTVYPERRYRTIPAGTVLRDLDQAGSSRYVIFTDENFIGFSPADHADRIALCAAIARRPRRILWGTQASINLADQPELMRAMHAAGCRVVFVGMEASEDDDLKELNKGVNRRVDFKAAVARIHAHGIAVIASCILGLDHQDRDYPDRLAAFLKDAAVDYVRIFYMTAWPGTPLYRRLEAEGRVCADWARVRKDVPCVKYRHFTPEEIYAAKGRVYRRFNSPGNILRTVGRWLFRDWSLAPVFFPEILKSLTRGNPVEEKYLKG